MHVAIIGNGVVGSALRKWIDKNTVHKIHIYDPPQGELCDVSMARVVFISVPVPTKDDGDQDISILRESLALCNSTQIIFIRSTVLPGTCDTLHAETGLNIFAMPEFLTERMADSDFCQLPIIMGMKRVPLFIEHLFPGKTFYLMTNKEAEMAKYAHNVFGAMKVTYFNHLFETCSRMDVDFDGMKRGMFHTGFINEQHTSVPGVYSKERGYGGHCFPKDVKAFTYFFKKLFPNPSITMFEVIDRDNRVFRNAK